MEMNYNHSQNTESVATRIKLVLLAFTIIVYSYIVIDATNGKSEAVVQYENQTSEIVSELEKGEYEATLTISTENGRVTIPVTFIVENDGEFGKVNLLNK